MTMMKSSRTLFLFLILMFVSILPLIVTELPLILDYPNHLARIYLIAQGNTDFLASHFNIVWKLVPNLAFDLIGPPLVWVFGLEWGGKLFLILTVVLVGVGGWFLSQTLFGTASPMVLLIFAVTFNQAMWYGFMNFIFAMGLTLIFVGVWIRLRDKPVQRLIFGLAAAAVLFISHVYGLLIFLMFAGLLEASFILEAAKGRLRHIDIKTALVHLGVWFAVASVSFAVILLFLSGGSSSGGGYLESFALEMEHARSIGKSWLWNELSKYKAVFLQGYQVVDFAVVVLIAGLLGATWLVAFRARKVSLPALAIFVGAIILGLLSFIVPGTLFSGANADWRFVVPGAFFAIAAAPWPWMQTRTRAVVLSGVCVAVLAHSVSHAHLTFANDDIYQDYKTVEVQLPRNSSAFAYSACTESSDYYAAPFVQHLVSLVVANRNVFYPSLFAYSDQQVLEYQEPEPGLIDTVFTHTDDIDFAKHAKRFDYAINLDPEFGTRPECPVPDGWRVVANAGSFTLLQPESSAAR